MTDTTDSSHGERTHEVTLELTEHAHDQLVEKARRDGEPVDTLASEIVIDQLSHTDRIIHADTGVYWSLITLSDSSGVSAGEALRWAVRNAHKELDDGDGSDDQRGLLARARSWLGTSSTVEQNYNTEVLTERRFTYLTAREIDSGVEMECDLCGRVFRNDIEACFSHIAGHEEHITESIDPFETLRKPTPDKVASPVRAKHLSKRQREQDSRSLGDVFSDGGGD